MWVDWLAAFAYLGVAPADATTSDFVAVSSQVNTMGRLPGATKRPFPFPVKPLPAALSLSQAYAKL